MNRYAPLVFIAAFGTAALFCQAAPVPEKTPPWQPDKSALAGLAAPVNVAGYQIRPPLGYTLHTAAAPGGGRLYAWVSPPHADGTQSYLMLMPVVPPPDAGKYTLDQVVNKFIAPIQRHRASFTRTVVEHSTINGLPFVRVHWAGTETVSGRKMRGFNYVGKDGGTYLAFASQDFEEYSQTGLPLAEAGALTLKKIGK